IPRRSDNFFCILVPFLPEKCQAIEMVRPECFWVIWAMRMFLPLPDLLSNGRGVTVIFQIVKYRSEIETDRFHVGYFMRNGLPGFPNPLKHRPGLFIFALIVESK